MIFSLLINYRLSCQHSTAFRSVHVIGGLSNLRRSYNDFSRTVEFGVSYERQRFSFSYVFGHSHHIYSGYRFRHWNLCKFGGNLRRIFTE